jgi:hypothetical protein
MPTKIAKKVHVEVQNCHDFVFFGFLFVINTFHCNLRLESVNLSHQIKIVPFYIHKILEHE